MSKENKSYKGERSESSGRTIQLRESEALFIRFYHENEEIGRMNIKDGKLTFTGDVDESARLFFDKVISIHSEFMSR